MIKHYRSDIDGLRALSILMVIIFHAFPSVLQGGFIGVDIFFVISGYLITSILLENMDQNKFSFIDFYSRRIKRLYPCLLAVLMVTLIYGWFVLFPQEFEQLSKHALASSVYINNFILYKESGYFNAASNLKPLLHLWSLGIEEQFYLIWPFMLYFLKKKKLPVGYCLSSNIILAQYLLHLS
jgi:peptidoglycan/LPS O-acetylase OafA/YrhL